MSLTSDPRIRHECQDCGADLSHRRADALRCEPCIAKARTAAKRERRAAGLEPRCTVPACTKARDRDGLCQMHNWRLINHGSVDYTRPGRQCTYGNCTSKHNGHGLCQTHLTRQKKGLPMGGSARTVPGKRYLQVVRRNHPLAGKGGRVFVHRMVLYDTSGGGRMPCFWCARPLEWGLPRFSVGAMVVDHYDHDRRNNSPTNLLPSCNPCNAGRIRGFNAVRIPQYSVGLVGT